MKKLLAVVLTLLVGFASGARAATTWNGSASGAWTNVANWTSIIPTSADTVTYGAGPGTGIAVLNPTQTLDTSFSVLGFTVGNNSASPIVINSGTGVNTLTIGVSGILLNSASGGSFTCNPDIVMNGAQSFTTGTGRSITVSNVTMGANLLTVNTAGSTSTTAINGLMTGTSGLTKSGPGTLTVAGTANTFSGAVTVSGGSLIISKLANAGSNSSIGTGSGTSNIVLNGGTLTYSGAGGDTTDRAIDMRAGAAINNNGSGAISFTAANVLQGGTASARTLTLGGSQTGDNTFGSILTNSGTGTSISILQKAGAGKWIVTGTQLYTGSTIINQGTLRVGGSSVLGGAAGSTGDASNIVFGTTNPNGALEFETAANLGPADQVRFRNTGGTTGTGGFMKYVGTTDQTVSKAIQCDSSIGVRLESDSVGGSILYNGSFANVAGNRPIYLGGTGTGDNTVGSAISANGSGTLTKDGGGTWILTQANTYSGATTISGGTLKFTGSGAVASSSGISIASGAVLEWGRDANVDRNLSGAGKVLRSTTTGNAVFSGSNGSFTGSWEVVSGYVGLVSDSTVGAAGVGMTLNGGGIYFTTSGPTLSDTRTITLGAAGGILNGSTGNTNTFAAKFTGAGALTKVSGSKAILTATNDYTGNTTVSVGTLELGGAGQLNNGNYAGTIAVATALSINTTASQTLSGVMSGAGTLTKASSGALLIDANNTLSGNVTIDGGTVVVNAGKSLAWANATKANADALVISGGGTLEIPAWGAWGTTGPLGELNYNDGYLRVNNGTIRLAASDATASNRGINIDAGGATLEASAGVNWTMGSDLGNTLYGTGPLSLTGAGGGSVATPITTAGGLTKSGGGTWTLTGTNTYAGTTTINAGTLELSGGAAIADAGAVTLADAVGATLKLNASETIGSLSGGGSSGGNVDLQANTLTVGSGSYSGALQGTGGGLTKIGAGTLTLNETSTYTGPTTVSNGTLEVVATFGALGDTAITVKTNATLQLDGSTGTGLITIEAGGTLQGNGTAGGSVLVSGTLAPGNSIGTMYVTGNLTLSGTTEMEISSTGSADLASVTGTLTYGGTLNVLNIGGTLGLNDSFNLFDFAGAPSGSFGTVSLPALDSGLSWKNDLGVNGTLTVVPEPTSVGLIGLIGLAGVLRRRMTTIRR